jgi:hypothetical protein
MEQGAKGRGVDQIETVGHLPCSLIITIMGQFPNRGRMLPLALLVPSMCSTPSSGMARYAHRDLHAEHAKGEN